MSTFSLTSNLHVFEWPLKELHLAGFRGKLKYAQLLNDASEITFRTSMEDEHANLVSPTPDGAVTLLLPVVAPRVEVPVIELVLND
jgi:alpha-L-fucosidase